MPFYLLSCLPLENHLTDEIISDADFGLVFSGFDNSSILNILSHNCNK